MNTLETNLRNLLRNNIVVFTFKKVDGTIRHAIGTRNLTLASNYTQTEIPTPKGEEQPTSYFDVEKMGWRSWKEGSVISLDGFADMPKRTAETPKREIPVSKPTDGGAEIDLNKIVGGLFGRGGGGFGGGFARPSKEEVSKFMEDLDKEIDIVPPMGGGVCGGKVGAPVATEKGVALPLGEIGVEDFAKIVAHYVVEELISRIK